MKKKPDVTKVPKAKRSKGKPKLGEVNNNDNLVQIGEVFTIIKVEPMDEPIPYGPGF